MAASACLPARPSLPDDMISSMANALCVRCSVARDVIARTRA
jgi:hypothetical protein